MFQLSTHLYGLLMLSLYTYNSLNVEANTLSIVATLRQPHGARVRPKRWSPVYVVHVTDDAPRGAHDNTERLYAVL